MPRSPLCSMNLKMSPALMMKAVQANLHTSKSPSLRGGEASMLYIVEVGSFGGDLGAAMSNMRTWLDHHRSQPVVFRQVPTNNGATFRLEFASEGEALAFVGTLDR